MIIIYGIVTPNFVVSVNIQFSSKNWEYLKNDFIKKKKNF